MNEPPNPEVAVFAAALELAADQRGVYLDQACAGDATLRRQVEALLRVHDDAGNFFDKLASVAKAAAAEGTMPGSSGTVRLPGIPCEKAGDRIGRYKLLQQIGEGGCGVVYMAEQEEPVRRRVALKVIKLGMDTKSVIARFEAERQALALMDHPNIAKVLEAGATETGRPYFVMELVRGIKITDYCDENNLSTVARLELFIHVCQAIQHAHQKGIIHRDIKPSNILVADHDGVPVPKIIDFGIAKATTDQRLTDKTLFTAFEQFMGTPAYMSPEQATLSGLGIDTRSDIYSLGVLLYELLTGRTPFDTKDLLQAGLDEIRRVIREQEPARPSNYLSTMLGANLTAIAKHRKAEPPKLIYLVQGDLDWIVMKALEKDRTRRYETANGLAADIQRYLANEPVTACPPSNFYRLQKLVRRNKPGFIAASVVAAALIIGIGNGTWRFFKERKVRQQGGSAIIDTPNLLGFWRFDSVFGGNSCVNGYTGTLQGNARIGPPKSGSPLVSDPANQALLLDGNSYLTTSLTGHIVSEGTVLAWVYLTSQPSTAGNIFAIIGQSHAGNDFNLLIQTDDHIYFYTDEASATVYPEALPLNEWHFLAATFVANSTRNIYLDGQLVASSIAGSHSANGQPFWIGNDQVFGPRCFQGRIDEVAVFNRALTASEIGVILDSEAASSRGDHVNAATGNTAAVDVILTSVPLTDALRQLALQMKLNIQFDSALLKQKAADGTPTAPPIVTEKWRRVTPFQALQALLDNYGWQMTLAPGPINLVSAKAPNAAGPQESKVNLLDNVSTNGAAAEGNEVIPDMTIDDVSLGDAIRQMALQAGLNIIFDSRLGNQLDVKVSAKWKNLTARQALKVLLDNYGLQMTHIPDNPVLHVTAEEPGSARPQSTKVNLLENAHTNGAATLGDQVMPVITLQDLPLSDAIWHLARQAGLNVEIDPAAFNQIQLLKVTETWKNVTARQALQALLESHELEVTQIPGIPMLRVVAKNAETPLDPAAHINPPK